MTISYKTGRARSANDMKVADSPDKKPGGPPTPSSWT